MSVMARPLDAALAILNGLVGDRLGETGNELATRMCLVAGGAPIAPTRDALVKAYPSASSRVVVLVHGLMCTESSWEDDRGESFGSCLSRDLGFTPLFVRYNTGLSIAENGARLSDLFASVTEAYPVALEEIVLLGHSMGGLVLRSACHWATVREHAWIALVKRAIYVGTPHRGAPLERAGRTLTRALYAIDDPFTKLAAEIGDLRSTGIKDLGDPRHPVPLLPTIDHCLVAGSLSATPWIARLFGDAMVPIESATEGACRCEATMKAPPAHVRLLLATGHMKLARSSVVYEHVRRFCDPQREDAA
jgi:pimeloyl-ACP methyl ester carboxylesterase